MEIVKPEVFGGRLYIAKDNRLYEIDGWGKLIRDVFELKPRDWLDSDHQAKGYFEEIGKIRP